VTGSGPSNAGGTGADGCICITGADDGAWETIAAGNTAAADGGTVVGAVRPSPDMSNSISLPPDGGGGGGGALVCCKRLSGVASPSKSKRSVISAGDADGGSMICSAAMAAGAGAGAAGTAFTAQAGYDMAPAVVVAPVTPPKSAAAIFCFSVMAGASGASLVA